MTPSTDSAHVKVTLDVIYRELLDVKATVADLPNDVADHEARIRVIEKTIWAASGISGVVGGVLVALIGAML